VKACEVSVETYLRKFVGVEVGVHVRVTSPDGLIDCEERGKGRRERSAPLPRDYVDLEGIVRTENHVGVLVPRSLDLDELSSSVRNESKRPNLHHPTIKA
jgi:hypothetical protein